MDVVVLRKMDEGAGVMKYISDKKGQPEELLKASEVNSKEEESNVVQGETPVEEQVETAILEQDQTPISKTEEKAPVAEEEQTSTPKEEVSSKGDSFKEQKRILQEMETLLLLQDHNGAWLPNDKFADAVDCSLENIETTIPEVLSTLHDKQTVWTTIIGLGFMLSK